VHNLLEPGQRLSTEVLGSTVVVEKQVGKGAQGEVYAGEMRGDRVAVKWYKPEWIAKDLRLRERLRRTRELPPPNDRFLWPRDLVLAPELPGFGYVMPFREARFREFSEIIQADVSLPPRPSFRTLATAGLETVEGYLRLHAMGLCYVDISGGNVAMDVDTGEVRICDCDNVDENGKGMMSRISGTEGFMAPEIVQNRAYPTRQTDLWSLAVLLFWAFLKNHPLLGRKEYEHPILTEDVALRLWGEDAQFIFDDDETNAPVAGWNDYALLFWPIFPEFLRAHFRRAFTDGIRDPQHGRVLETEWRTAMARLRDSIVPCPECQAESFCDEQMPARCWNCDAALPTPRCITLPGYRVVMCEGAALFPHHLDLKRLPDGERPVARVVRHESRPDLMGLANAGRTPWRVVLPNGEERTVGPGGCVGLHPHVRMLFGNVEAEIV
jgi:DNA-binding helix-hairpin-helix protein with protein kinase domain